MIKAGAPKGLSLAHKLSIIAKKQQSESKGSAASLLKNRNMPNIINYLKNSSMQKSHLSKNEGNTAKKD